MYVLPKRLKQCFNFLQYYEKPLGTHDLWSKLEIDPATMGWVKFYVNVN